MLVNMINSEFIMAFIFVISLVVYLNTHAQKLVEACNDNSNRFHSA